MRAATLVLFAAAMASASELVVNVGTQSGSFLIGHDIGPMNPHDYRPNEFVTNDFVFEGLTAWDGEHTAGLDGIAGTDDDFVAPSLAISWTTNYAAHVAAPSTTKYEITFTLRSGVTFHDGTPWNAAAAKANVDQIMGGYGEPGGTKALMGLHDWMGFTQSLDGWSAVDDMTFKLTFTEYYEAALRELCFIRPFRFTSIAALPSMANMELSHNKWVAGGTKVWTKGGFTMRGVSAPIGTGPYKVVHKLLGRPGSTGTFTLSAADFNASCYVADKCDYTDKVCGGAPCEHVVEVRFEKHAGHRKNPAYDSVILRAYPRIGDVKDALQAGTLHLAYGVQTLTPSAFLSLATAEEGSSVVAHKNTMTDLNTRVIVLNSGGVLNTKDLRKVVMGALLEARQALTEGELAEEAPIDTLFDPKLPHCSVLSTLSSPADLAATKSASVSEANITRDLRFLYITDVAHNRMIAAAVTAALHNKGIGVKAIPVDKATYNTRHCDYLTDPDFFGSGEPHYYGQYYDSDDAYGEDVNYNSWDIAISETWGPPYDATSKLWDMTHGPSGSWCSQEADAVAINNMESYSVATFVDKVRGTGSPRSGGMSNIVDPDEREAVYTELLTALHDEAIFLPLTAKRQTAVTNTNVAGFKFGFLEYDLPLANLYPTSPSPPPPPPSSSDELPSWGAALIAVFGVVFIVVVAAACLMYLREKQGKPIFCQLDEVAVARAAGPKTGTQLEDLAMTRA